MIPYPEFLEEIKSYAEPEYAAFHKRLLKNDNINVLGVRVPTLKKIAKKYKNFVPTLLSFPDEYYEVTFIKLQAVALLPYNFFINYVDKCVPLIDNWATCDCFTPKCIEKHKDEFLGYIYTYLLSEDKEFYQRFALTTLLHFYVEEKYYQTILDIIQEDINTDYYYVHMAAAWLLAELITKFYDDTIEFLKYSAKLPEDDECYIDKKTHNKAIQKACESYRLTAEQKTYLKGLKI